MTPFLSSVWSKSRENLIFLKKSLFTHQYIPSDSKFSSSDIDLCQFFFQSSKHFWNSFFDIAFSLFSDSVFISSILANHRLFMVLSSEYGGWGMVLCLAKNSLTSCEMWAGALSSCNFHELFYVWLPTVNYSNMGANLNIRHYVRN